LKGALNVGLSTSTSRRWGIASREEVAIAVHLDTNLLSPDTAVASAVVAEAVVIAAEADARLAQEAIDVAAAEVLAAADRAADAAQRARDARAFAATLAAESVARAATQAAEVERARVDEAADRVRAAATEAVETLLGSLAAPRTPAEASDTAKRLAAIVSAAADVSARDSARAAAMTAEAVEKAAAQVAMMVSAIEASAQREVASMAGDLANVAAATAQSMALVTEKRVESNARLARQAGEAVVEKQAVESPAGTAYWAAQTSFPAELTSPARAGDFVSAHLIALGLPHLVDDLRVVVGELATNAVQHGRTPLTVTLELSGQLLTLAVVNGSSVVPLKSLGGLLDVDGRGLTIVQQLSREWGVTGSANGSNAVWASFPATHD
jgi:hypothetical protein